VIQDLRSLPKLGQAFYAPIVFKLKAPPYPVPEEYVEAEPSGSAAVKATEYVSVCVYVRERERERVRGSPHIGSCSGYGAYRTSGWGMLAFYKEDFDKLGGFGVRCLLAGTCAGECTVRSYSGALYPTMSTLRRWSGACSTSRRAYGIGAWRTPCTLPS
jgi:hypothetical protein